MWRPAECPFSALWPTVTTALFYHAFPIRLDSLKPQAQIFPPENGSVGYLGTVTRKVTSEHTDQVKGQCCDSVERRWLLRLSVDNRELGIYQELGAVVHT